MPVLLLTVAALWGRHSKTSIAERYPAQRVGPSFNSGNN